MDTVSFYAHEDKPHFVYELVDPRDHVPFYVGITIELYARYRQHMNCDGTNPEKDQRVQEILDSGHLPIMHRLECVENADKARKREQYWIQHYTNLGIHLLNAEVMHLEKVHHRGKISIKAKVPKDFVKVNDRAGRRNTFADMIDLLVKVHETEQWPEHVSAGMRRYYQRNYPEFFRNGKRWEKMRNEKIQKAAQIRVGTTQKAEPEETQEGA